MADNRRAANDYATDAEQSRERLNDTIDNIQQRLTPRAMVGEAVEAAQEKGAELARAAGEHKLALGLIGGAVGLLFLARSASKQDKRQRSERDADEANALRRGWDNVRTAAGDASEAATEKWQQARERTADLAAKARYQATEASRLAGENLNTNPLVGAIVGLAAGAFAGALLPRTQTEDSLVGEHRDRFADAAREAVKAAVDAGKESLAGYGLSGDAFGEKLGSWKEQAGEIAKTVGQAAADSIRNNRGGGNA